MSEIMNSNGYCIGSDMDYGRAFDQYIHKGSENFNLALSIPESSPHPGFMAEQHYGAFESRGSSGDSYQDMNPMANHDSSHAPPMAAPQQLQHPQQAMYQMGVVGGLHGGGNNPQFPPQNMYIPSISQHGNIMAAQTSGYVVQGAHGHANPVYTSAGLGLSHHAPHPMMVTAGGMIPASYYQRPLLTRSGGSPTSGGSPSPGSDDSDDSTPNAHGRGKRPSPETPVEPVAPVKGKKARVSKKSKKKKDPNEPQKPVSAYALFFRDTQASIKGASPNASFGEVSKIVASMWDSLDADNKGVYKKKTEAAKKEYLKALAAYRASLVSKGEGDPAMYGQPGQGYVPFPGNSPYGFPPNANPGGTMSPHPQGHSPPQLSPLAKKSPLLSSLMTTEAGPQQQALMNPPMSQPMPPSAPSMMNPHGSIPNMNPSTLGPQPGQPCQPPHQNTQTHLGHMTSVPPTSPYMTQNSNPSLGSPVSSMGSDVGSPGTHSIHQPVQHSPNQQQQQQQSQQQQTTAHSHQLSPQHQGLNHNMQQQPQHQHHGSNQGGGHPVPGPTGTSLCSSGSCIRSGCTNPAVHNPEWEDEYCSNECVVNHCRDVFSTWVASNSSNAPTYPAPVK